MPTDPHVKGRASPDTVREIVRRTPASMMSVPGT